jgi:hypothetical protein
MRNSHTRLPCAVLGMLSVLALSSCSSIDARQNSRGAGMTNSDGLIAFYPLNGSGTDTVGGFNGELVGTTPTTDRFGREGEALAFDGNQDEVVIRHPPPMNRQGTTVALWVKFASGGKNVEWEDVFDGKGFSQPILSQDDGNGIRVFALSLYSGMLRSNGQGSGHSLIPASNVRVEMGRWYHMAMVRGAEHRLFIDGEQAQVKEEVFNVCTCQPWLIGATGAWGNQKPHLHGAVDDVRVYGRALSADEILKLSEETIESLE